MSTSRARILIVDDEEDIRASLRMILDYEGYETVEAGSGPAAIAAVRDDEPAAVLLDIKMPRMDGLEVLRTLRASNPDLPIVMVSGHGTISTAVEATRAGAFDFMEKPLQRDRVLLVLRNALESRTLREQVKEYRLSFEERYRLVGDSDAIDEIQQAVARIAPTKASVLITGESGTGKELVARAIHRNSPRCDAEFVKVNCAAIPEELIESELFGHRKGSFTGATADQKGKFVRADGGTLFLDEVGDMSLKTQAKVLRALQDGDIEPVGAAETVKVDVRVVAATNKDLPGEIAEGRFREDLYYRLTVVPLHMPPLRERPGDIEALVRHFAARFAEENGTPVREFAPAAIARLRALPWRGNVRELRNAVERLLIMSAGATIEAQDLPVGLGAALGEAAGAVPEDSLVIPGRDSKLQDFKDAAERAYLVERLNANDWNIAATAKAIETPRSNLYKRLEYHGIDRDRDGR